MSKHRKSGEPPTEKSLDGHLLSVMSPSEKQERITNKLRSRVEELTGILQKLVEQQYCADGYRNVSVPESTMDEAERILKGKTEGND